MVRRPFAPIVVLLLAAACSGGESGSGSSTNATTAVPTTVVTTTSTVPPPTDLALRFADATREAGIDFVSATPLGESAGTSEMDLAKMRSGAAAGDFDGDGRMDLLVLGGGLRSDALYRNRGDGTFEEVTGIGGDLHLGSGVAVADYDGDGDQDIYVTSHGPPGDPQPGHHRLLRNDGNLAFTDVAAEAGVAFTSRTTADGFGAAFGDFDLDGDLDLFVAGWVRDSAGNRLFRNEGDGTFTDVTAAAGIVDDGIRGFSPCLVDMDGDRYPEILLVADFGTSRYFVNDGDGTFTERTDDAGVGQEWSGMGTAVGDFDGDGLVDWYVTAIHDDQAQGRGDGNKLYYNLGGHTFREAAAEAGVDDGGWGWGAVAVDLDHDGLLDIVETNGWHFPGYESYTGEMARVWMATGDGTFSEIAAPAGLDHTLMGLAMIDFDYDNDGDRDIAITAANDQFRIYRNELSGPDTHWLRVFLDPGGDTAKTPGGLGSTVTVEAGGRTMTRLVGGCANYLSTSEPSAHFGLGAAETAETVTVTWTDGSTTVLGGVTADQTLTVSP